MTSCKDLPHVNLDSKKPTGDVFPNEIQMRTKLVDASLRLAVPVTVATACPHQEDWCAALARTSKAW
eukprot:4916249-Amphidinium_carterae.1